MDPQQPTKVMSLSQSISRAVDHQVREASCARKRSVSSGTEYDASCVGEVSVEFGKEPKEGEGSHEGGVSRGYG